MADVVRLAETASKVVERPVVRLLRRHNQTVWIAVLSAAFPDLDSALDDGSAGIPVEDFHARVDAMLAELAMAGHQVPQRGDARMNGRDFSQALLNDQLLGLSANTNRYTLTQGAVEALEFFERLGSDRTVATTARIATILQVSRELAAMVTQDPDSRIGQLKRQQRRVEAEQKQIQEELDRLHAGEPVSQTPDDVLINAYANLEDLLSRLPSDMARIRESVDAQHRRLARNIREGNQSTGQSVLDYVDELDTLLTDTAEGRAFMGMREVLSDDATLRELHNDLCATVDHELFQTVLNVDERRAMTSMRAFFRTSVNGVRARMDRCMSTLRAAAQSGSQIEEREFARVLNALQNAMAEWLSGESPRAVLPFHLLPEPWDMEVLAESFDTSLADGPPPAFADVSALRPEPPSREEIMALGGPQRETLAALADLIPDDPDTQWTFGELFNQMDPQRRRPVEMFGLWQAAASVDYRVGATPSDPFYTVRPDGSTCTYWAEEITLTPEQAKRFKERARD